MQPKKILKKQPNSPKKVESQDEIRVLRKLPLKKPRSIEALAELRSLKELISKLSGVIDQLLIEIGTSVEDIQQIRQDMFYSNLKKMMKNKKKVKKEFDKKKDPLLVKCGVKTKVLTTEDVERIKTRFELG